MTRKQEAAQEKVKEAHCTIGKVKRYHGVRKELRSVRRGWAEAWARRERNCGRVGRPLWRCGLEGVASSSRTAVGAFSDSLEVVLGELVGFGLCLRSNRVSGRVKSWRISATAKKATFLGFLSRKFY